MSGALTDASSIVIVGAGQAGFQAAAALRQHGYAGGLTLVSGELELPYQRPPLSKGYLAGRQTAQQLRFRNEDFYRAQGITLLHAHALSIDREQHAVELDDGSLRRYDHLVLATGATHRVLPIPGSQASGVCHLRSRVDADRLALHLKESRRVAVIGAGFIGMEFAAHAASTGCDVVVVDAAAAPMTRTLSSPSRTFFREALEALGVGFRFECQPSEVLSASGKVHGLALGPTDSMDVDLVLICIGVKPNDRLARGAGLAVDNGILVDQQLLTDDPCISAIGDVACFIDATTGRRARLESVQNASDQARYVAQRVLHGAERYEQVPWFWSDIGDLKLQIAGLSDASDDCVVLGDAATRQFSVLRFRDDRFVAAECVNWPSAYGAARKILAHTTPLMRSLAIKAGFDLKDFVRNIGA